MLAVVEHNTDLCHCILLTNTNMLDRKSKCQNQLVQEARDIKLYPNNLNQEDGFSLLPIQIVTPLIHSLEERRQQATLPHFTSLNTNIHMTEVYYSLPFTSYRQKFILFAQILLLWPLETSIMEFNSNWLSGSPVPSPPNYYCIHLNQNKSP